MKRAAGHSILTRYLVATIGLLAALLSACAASPPAPNISKVEILLKRGDGFYFNSRYEEAVKEYGQAVELSPRLAAARHHRGRALAALGKTKEAMEDFDRAVLLDPESAAAYLTRGVLSYRLGKYSDAIDDFDRVIELDPWTAEARYYKALACEKVGRLREAVEAYRGYIHCSVPREDASVDFARDRIRALESGTLP